MSHGDDRPPGRAISNRDRADFAPGPDTSRSGTPRRRFDLGDEVARSTGPRPAARHARPVLFDRRRCSWGRLGLPQAATRRLRSAAAEAGDDFVCAGPCSSSNEGRSASIPDSAASSALTAAMTAADAQEAAMLKTDSTVTTEAGRHGPQLVRRAPVVAVPRPKDAKAAARRTPR